MRVLTPCTRLLIAVALLLPAPACAPRTLEPPSAGGMRPEPAESALIVENGRWEDVTAFVVRAGVPIRLGVVAGNATRVFRLPSSVIGPGTDLRFGASVRGSRRTITTELVDLPPGREAVWMVGSGSAGWHLAIR